MKRTKYGAPECAVFCSNMSLPSLQVKYSPMHPVLTRIQLKESKKQKEKEKQNESEIQISRKQMKTRKEDRDNLKKNEKMNKCKKNKV